MTDKELTLFDFMDQEKISTIENELKKQKTEIVKAIPKMQQGEIIQFKGRIITKDKFYEVHFENHYHELFHDAEDVLAFLKDEGIL